MRFIKYFVGTIFFLTSFIVFAQKENIENLGYDFSDTIFILQLVDDKYLLSALPSGRTIGDMPPNYHFNLLYLFLSKYGPKMLPLDVNVKNIEHQLLVANAEKEVLFSIGDHLMSNGDLMVFIEDKDYQFILWLLNKSDLRSGNSLTDIENIKEFSNRMRAYAGGIPKHPAYDGRPLRLSTRRDEIDTVVAEEGASVSVGLKSPPSDLNKNKNEERKSETLQKEIEVESSEQGLSVVGRSNPEVENNVVGENNVLGKNKAPSSHEYNQDERISTDEGSTEISTIVDKNESGKNSFLPRVYFGLAMVILWLGYLLFLRRTRSK